MNQLCGLLFITLCSIICGTYAFPQNFQRHPIQRKSYEAEPESYQPMRVINKTLIENETYMYGARQGNMKIIHRRDKPSIFPISHNERLVVGPPRVSLIQEKVDTSFVFPGELESSRPQFIQKFDDGGPSCANGLTFCEDVDIYPINHIKNIKQRAMEFSALFGTDEITETQITQRIDVDSRELCDSIQHIVYPKMAKNKDKDWLFIMNDNKEQGIRVEQCKTTGPCQFVDNLRSYSSQCEQKYIYRKMVSVDNTGNPQPDYFPMPSCCACKLRLIGFADTAARMTPAKTRRSTRKKNLDTNVFD